MSATRDPADADDLAPAASTELERQRQRSRELESQLTALRASESFRLGQAIVTVLRPRGLRAAVRRLRRGQFPVAKQLGAPKSRQRVRPKREWTAGAVLFVSLGPHGADAARAIRQAVTMLVAVRPVLLADVDQLDERGDADFPVEHVIGLEEWCRHRPAGEWGAYVSARVSEVMVEHRIKRVVVFPAPSDGSGSLTAVLAPVFLPQMASSELNLLHD